LDYKTGQFTRRQTAKFCPDLETLLEGLIGSSSRWGLDPSDESPHLEVNQGRALIVREIAENKNLLLQN